LSYGFSQPANAPYYADHAELLISSYNRVTGKHLISPDLTGEAAYQVLFEAPFALASHDSAEDPMFNYGNLTAQKLFEMDWATLLTHPSRHSAEPVNRAERARLLERVTKDGFIEDYQGVRVSSTGKRFMIEEAMIWNLVDINGQYLGQAAALYEWTRL
jgi:hypothetical protein